jgi:uncharacterized protein DUF4410
MGECASASPANRRLIEMAGRSFLFAVLLLLTSCAQTSIRPTARSTGPKLPPPARILLYDFQFTAADVNEYQGIMRQQPSIRSAVARQHEIGKAASEALATNLTDGLRRLGFIVQRVPRGTAAGITDLVIDGQFVSVDEGSPLRRLVIGFGAGAAIMESRVRLRGMNQKKNFVEFTTRAESGRLPGAVATVPVGAALPAGISLGLAAGGVVASSMSANTSNITGLATANANQTLRYLADFFADQGWISFGQAKAARNS